MDETAEFERAADAVLARLERALDACGAPLEYEVRPGGVLELEFADGSKIVVNRNAAVREIWVAAREGGFHFRCEGGRWVDTRDGSELFESLSRLASRQAGSPVRLA